MRYTRSFLLGTSLVVAVIVLAIVMYYFSLGICPIGTFSCDNKTCVPLSRICDRYNDCKDGTDEDSKECFLIHGSTDFMYFLLNRSLSMPAPNISHIDCPAITPSLPTGCHCTEINSVVSCPNAGLIEAPKIGDAKSLLLRNNNLKLTSDSFVGHEKLHILNIEGNKLDFIPEGIFSETPLLISLFLSYNHLKVIRLSDLEDLPDLIWLFIASNQLTYLELPPFQHLNWLNLSDNQLTFNHPSEVFPSLPSLFELFLDRNRIAVIKADLFTDLPSLQLLRLRGNLIRKIEPRAFDNLLELQELDLSDNLLKELPPAILYPLCKLGRFVMSNNSLRISEELLNKSTELVSLGAEGIDMSNINFNALRNLTKLRHVQFQSFRYCSLIPSVLHCRPNSDGVSDLKDLLSRPALRFSAWVVAFVTLLGNAMVLWGRFRSRDENRALSLLIRNLAVADMLMGVYLLVISIQDARFRGVYNHYSRVWTNSWSCIIIGSMAMVSIESSMLILVFMSVERFLLIVNPLGGYNRLSPRAARRILCNVWIAGITFAILPIWNWRNSTKFYGMSSGMCFPLHVLEKYSIGWEYSAFIFIGVNFLGLLIIAAVYCVMFISVWNTQRAAPPSTTDCEFAIRFFFIVLTDACCWAPIIFIKILRFFDVDITSEVCAWLVVFILPLNSAVNPILYTFTTPKYRSQLTSFSWRYSTNRSSNAGESLNLSLSHL